MREIKFRFWDGDKLRLVNSIGWQDGEIDWVDTPKYSGPIETGMKLLQYTGIKDKGDVEIYEGDMVTFLFNSDSEKRIGEVVCNGPRFSLKTNKVFCGDFVHHAFGKSSSTNHEVIGNIYENKN